MVAQRLTGAGVVVEYLVRQGVRFAVGVPEHGCWNLTDALLDRSERIRTLQVTHEQPAVQVDGSILGRLRAGLLDGFTELGSGVLDVAAMVKALDEIGHAGWLLVEQASTWHAPAEAAVAAGSVLRFAIRERDR